MKIYLDNLVGLKSCRRFINWLLPFQCPGCRKFTVERGMCGSCWGKLTFLSDPCCAQCSYPFSFFVQEGALCGKCLATPPLFQKGLSVFIYDTVSKNLILKFKHGKDLSLLPLLSEWLFQRGKPFFEAADLILPVPLHWTRLWMRRFNQAALLAKNLSQKTGIPYTPTLLKRTRRTPSQGHLNVKQRIANVARAFKVDSREQLLLKGARIILVDDVYTTGATLEACAKVLLAQGARCVMVLTLARVVR